MKKSLLALILCGLLLLFSSGCGGSPGSSGSPADSSVGTETSSASTTVSPITEPELNEYRKQLLIDLVNETAQYDPKLEIDLLGLSNGYIILYYPEGGDSAIVEEILGGYKIFSGQVHYPSHTGLYALNDDEALILADAYKQGKIDMDEVYPLLPERMQAGVTDEPDYYQYSS